jgi:hypothetical protein
MMSQNGHCGSMPPVSIVMRGFDCVLIVLSARVWVYPPMIMNPINAFTGLVSRY